MGPNRADAWAESDFRYRVAKLLSIEHLAIVEPALTHLAEFRLTNRRRQ